MVSDRNNEGPRDTAERLFANTPFTFLWIVFLGLVLTFVVWPVRNFFLVCWVYGSHAYFQEGIRVLKGEPIRFSTGEMAPMLADLVTGFVAFFASVGGLTFSLIFLVWLYERYFRKRGL